jgi:hypothetical protein
MNKSNNNNTKVETIETKVSKESTSSMEALRAKFGGEKNIQGIKYHNGYGATKGTLIEYMHPDASTFEYFHNVYKTVNIPGTFKSEERLRGFYLCAYLGEDERGCPIHDIMRFYDADYSMTFEQAIAEIDRVSKHNTKNPTRMIEPKGPAKKLWHIAMENGFNDPLDMFGSGAEIVYGQIAQKYGSNGNTRRVVVSADYLKTHPSTNSSSNRKSSGTFGNRLAKANANKLTINY